METTFNVETHCGNGERKKERQQLGERERNNEKEWDYSGIIFLLSFCFALMLSLLRVAVCSLFCLLCFFC